MQIRFDLPEQKLRVPSVLARISNWIAVVTLVVTMGGHWMLLQSVAWANMTANYARSMPLSRAVSIALSGEAPCQICKLVSEGKKAEKKQVVERNVTKLDLLFLPVSIGIFPPRLEESHSSIVLARAASSSPPLLPPPRLG